MSDKKQWIVIASGDEPLQDVTTQLQKKGFEIESKLEAIGQIVGRATEDAKKEALKLKGVADIQPSFDIHIGPPDAEIS